jgi:hypothetical protein
VVPDEEALARPTHGARLLVKLEPGAEGDGVYTLLLTTSDAEWRGQANVREEDGQVSLGDFPDGAPPRWLLQATHALLRGAWQRRRAGHVWPRRLARWRPVPDAAEKA